jgi:hypothetical protein
LAVENRIINSNYLYEAERADEVPLLHGVLSRNGWNSSNDLLLDNYMGKLPAFWPETAVNVNYDSENIYVRFRVIDKFVRCLTNQVNGPVWEDACVEFFFAPDPEFPERYFNLEINCCGTPLMHYNTIPGEEITPLSIDEINQIEILHSLDGIIDQEINKETVWSIHYRIPINILRRYSDVNRPKPGVEWRANFFKIAENSSNPHYLTWAPVEYQQPNFHLPQYFGILRFK